MPFLGMEIDHNKRDLTIHLDTYIQKTLAEYKAAVTKFLKLKQVPMQSGVVLTGGLLREHPIEQKAPAYRSFVAFLLR
jgi:hypothetical protein